MSKESFAKWSALIAEDPTLQSKVIEAQRNLASSIQEVLELAQSKGIELEVSDFFSVAASSTEDEELAAVAGGGTGCNLAAYGGTALCAAGAIVSFGVVAAASGVGVAGIKLSSSIADAAS